MLVEIVQGRNTGLHKTPAKLSGRKEKEKTGTDSRRREEYVTHARLEKI
jgi:hypothetical protein